MSKKAAKESNPQDSRKEALDVTIQAIDRQFGAGTIMRMGSAEKRAMPVLSTGSIGLNLAIGIGGYPRGRIIEIYGPESSGKTTLALHALAEAQRSGGVAAFIDAEHALDINYAQKLGVNIDDLLVSQPDFGEQALEVADLLVKSNSVDCVVIDSVAALVPKAEIDGEMGDSHMGLQARLMSQALRKITGSAARSKTVVIFINQIRMKIGVMFGSPETTTGGNALKFYSSVRLDIRRTGTIKKGEEVLGSRTRVRVVKNKVAPPFKEAEFDIIYGIGVYRLGDIVDTAVRLNILDKSGSWFSFEGQRLGQGRENTIALLDEQKDLLARVEARIMASMTDGLVVPPAPAAPELDEGADDGV
jgi:recombination protein RecA